MTNYVMLLLLWVTVTPLTERAEPSVPPLPKLSKKQMYADFDRLVSNLAQISPQLEIRQKLTGIDVFAQLARYRRQIEGVKNTEQFAMLIRKALITCQDGHTSLLWQGYFPDQAIYKKWGISQQAIRLLPIYDSLFVSWSAQKKLNIKLKYIDGRYYNLAAFSHQHQHYAAGLQLVACNAIPINDYIHRLNTSKRMMRWDFKHRHYFSEDFSTSYHLSERDMLQLSFQDATGKVIMGNFKLSDSLSFSKPLGQSIDTTRRVAFFAEQHVLYIRIPEMKEVDYYLTQIARQPASATIKKIVIDIRDNPGGSDDVWLGVLAKLIPRPIRYQDLLLCINSAVTREHYPQEAASWQKSTVPFLTNARYAVFYTGPAVIEPHASSLRFKGKIYVLQNENIYSSAGSLAAVAALDSDIVSVGSPTGRLLGKGINPLVFELPHSKLLYRIEPVIDCMNVREVADVFHDKVELPVELSLDEQLSRLWSKDLYSREYLISADPVFKKILVQAD